MTASACFHFKVTDLSFDCSFFPRNLVIYDTFIFVRIVFDIIYEIEHDKQNAYKVFRFFKVLFLKRFFLCLVRE